MPFVQVPKEKLPCHHNNVKSQEFDDREKWSFSRAQRSVTGTFQRIWPTTRSTNVTIDFVVYQLLWDVQRCLNTWIMKRTRAKRTNGYRSWNGTLDGTLRHHRRQQEMRKVISTRHNSHFRIKLKQQSGGVNKRLFLFRRNIGRENYSFFLKVLFTFTSSSVVEITIIVIRWVTDKHFLNDRNRRILRDSRQTMLMFPFCTTEIATELWTVSYCRSISRTISPIKTKEVGNSSFISTLFFRGKTHGTIV